VGVDTTHGHANAGVTVLIARTAQPHHLRDMAATLTERAQQMEANTPTEDEAFLAMMLTAAETSTRVTAEDVAHLRRLADWADAAPPAGWNGTLDKGETQRAVNAARERMR
jgi:hypothetical protein